MATFSVVDLYLLGTCAATAELAPEVELDVVVVPAPPPVELLLAAAAAGCDEREERDEHEAPEERDLQTLHVRSFPLLGAGLHVPTLPNWQS